MTALRQIVYYNPPTLRPPPTLQIRGLNLKGPGGRPRGRGKWRPGPEETAEEKTERKRRAAAVVEEALAEIEEAEEETAEPAELTASDLLAEAEADAAAVQGIPEPSVERWDAEGRFGAVGRPELQQHPPGASRFGRARREPFRPGSFNLTNVPTSLGYG